MKSQLSDFLQVSFESCFAQLTEIATFPSLSISYGTENYCGKPHPSQDCTGVPTVKTCQHS